MLPVRWNNALARESHAAPGFWPMLAAVLFSAFFIEFLIRRGATTLVPGLRIRPEQALPRAFAAHALCLAQGAIMIQCKFTALPVRPAQLQRRALHEIIARFAAAGIAFAPPPANASNPR